MALTGKQKAAMLLMSLDAATATELLKGVNPEMVEELALEVAHLDTLGYRSDKQDIRIARQFCDSLQEDERIYYKRLLKQMPENVAGSEKEKQHRIQIKDLQNKDEPFSRISCLDSRTIASVLKQEHPRSAAVVISELPAKKSSDVLNLLGVGLRLSIVARMQTCKDMTLKEKKHIAQTICESRLVGTAVTEDRESESLPTTSRGTSGRTTLILHKLCSGFRTALFKIIGGKSKETGKKLQTHFKQKQVDDLQINWLDIPQIEDVLLQRGLKGIGAKKLAPALVGADYPTIQKITSNISESEAAELMEETSHISDVRNEVVQEARMEVVRILQQMTGRN